MAHTELKGLQAERDVAQRRALEAEEAAEEAAAERDAFRASLDGVNKEHWVLAAAQEAEATELEGLRGKRDVAQRRAEEAEEMVEEATAERDALRAS